MKFTVVTRLALLLTFAYVCSFAQARPAKQDAKSKPATEEPEKPDNSAQPTSLDNLKDAAPAPVLACAGAFAKDATHAKLVTEFGARNVVYKDVATAGDVVTKATVLFDADPPKRAVFFWDDDKARAKPKSILIEAPSTWLGPGGIRNGLPLKELEKLNGGSFSMKGFGGVNGGGVANLKGPFAGIAGGCTLRVRLEPGIANPLPPRFAAVTGDQSIPSTNFLLRRTRAQVSEWSIHY